VTTEPRPSDFDEVLEEAGLAMMMGDVDDALELYDEAEELAMDARQHSQCLAGRATAFIGRKQFVDAVDLLREAIELAGDEAPAAAHGNLAFALDQLHRYDEAAAEHRHCIALHAGEDGPEHPRTLRKRSDLAYSMIGLGQLDEAEAILRGVVDGFALEPAREPEWYTQALINLGYFLLRSREDPEEAIRTFDRAEAMRDLCSCVSIRGEVTREGFPDWLEAVLLQNRAEACDALGQAREADSLRDRATRLRASAARNPFRGEPAV
jgi:tetratricopeptide (TPR) repeat protein